MRYSQGFLIRSQQGKKRQIWSPPTREAETVTSVRWARGMPCTNWLQSGSSEPITGQRSRITVVGLNQLELLIVVGDGADRTKTRSTLHPRGGGNRSWGTTILVMVLALLLAPPHHLTSLRLSFLIYKIKIMSESTSLAVVEIRITRSLARCLAHCECSVKIMREKIN